ncbi:MAG: hypothetical protein K6F50_04370 [Kiritimatiellae bacterium]|nr:hypothetical protein [Kiritimatiellia bacterium]
MTNFSLSSALKAAWLCGLFLLSGCGCSSDEKSGSASEEIVYGPDDVPSIESVARDAFAKGDFSAAETAARRLSEDKTLPAAAQSEGWNILGAISARKASKPGAAQEAAADARCKYLRAIVLDPGNFGARYNLACLYRDEFRSNRAAYVLFGACAAALSPSGDPYGAKAAAAAEKLAGQARARRGAKKGALPRDAVKAPASGICKDLDAFAWEDHAWDDAKANAKYAELLVTARMDAKRGNLKILAAELASDILASRPPDDVKALIAFAKSIVADLKAVGRAKTAAVYEEFRAFLQERR